MYKLFNVNMVDKNYINCLTKTLTIVGVDMVVLAVRIDMILLWKNE